MKIKKICLGLSLAGAIFYSSTSAACGCCGPLGRCLAEVAALVGIEANQVAAATREITRLARQQTSLANTIQTGIFNEIQQVNTANQSVVGAVKGRSDSVGVTLTKTATATSNNFNALDKRLERLAKTNVATRENIKTERVMGSENIPVNMRKLFAYQSLVTEENKPTSLAGEAVENGIEISIPFMMELIKTRTEEFNLTMNSESFVLNTGALERALFESDAINRFSSPIIPVEEIALYAYAAHVLSSGSEIRQFKDEGEGSGGLSVYAETVRQSSDAFSDFFAWDMALRTEIKTNEGSTSPLLMIKQSAFSPSDTYEEIQGIGTADRAELTRILKMYRSISNMLTYIQMQNDSHRKKFEAVEVGFRTREAINALGIEGG
ncbi:MAG: hypothetical protein ACJAS1_003145 [Oleiphilaceae bacterium]|jgi:hypothetical protein